MTISASVRQRLGLLALCFIWPATGAAMSLMDLGKVCVFSPVTGQVTMNGEPIAGARLVRRVEWQKKQQDHATTDDKGRFAFPALYERSVMKFLSGQFVANQVIEIEHKGQTYLAWKGGKWSEEENAELSGKPLKLHCELTNEPEIKYVGRHGINGPCTWQN